MSSLLNRILLTRVEKKLRYNKIYAIDQQNIEVKLIDTKREVFGTLKNYVISNYMSYRVTLYQGFTVSKLNKKLNKIHQNQ